MELPLQQLREDQDLYFFNMDLSTRAAYKTPAAMKTPQDGVNPSAEVACDKELTIKAKNTRKSGTGQMAHNNILENDEENANASWSQQGAWEYIPLGEQ